MNRPILLTAACAAALALALPGAATAAPWATSTLDLGSLRFSVEDTDANDGVDATMQQTHETRSAWACEGDTRPDGCNFGGWAASTSRDPSGTAMDSHVAPGAWTGVAIASPDLLQSSYIGNGPTGATGINTALDQGFFFGGTGRFTVQVDYRLAASGLDGVTFREVQAWAGILFFGAQGLTQTEDWLTAPAQGSASRQGTLIFSSNFRPGDFIETFIHTHVHTLSPSSGPIAAPVPEPATWALMFAGLAGVGLARRRQG